MFGLHGLVTPGKEEALKTNGGLMYYQYDGGNSITELTNRHGDESSVTGMMPSAIYTRE
jgi:hypothetical protein